MLANIRRELKTRPELRLNEDDFAEAFDTLVKAMHNKIDDKVWAYIMLGLSKAIRGKDGSKKANVRTDLG